VGDTGAPFGSGSFLARLSSTLAELAAAEARSCARGRPPAPGARGLAWATVGAVDGWTGAVGAAVTGSAEAGFDTAAGIPAIGALGGGTAGAPAAGLPAAGVGPGNVCDAGAGAGGVASATGAGTGLIGWAGGGGVWAAKGFDRKSPRSNAGWESCR